MPYQKIMTLSLEAVHRCHAVYSRRVIRALSRVVVGHTMMVGLALCVSRAMVISIGLFSQPLFAADHKLPLSTRGNVPISDNVAPAPIAQYPKRGEALPRGFIHQPPLIPHKYDYIVNLTRNGCITCHKPKMSENQPRSSATPIHASHYRADGQIDDGYYFCRQCHVAQQISAKIAD